MGRHSECGSIGVGSFTELTSDLCDISILVASLREAVDERTREIAGSFDIPSETKTEQTTLLVELRCRLDHEVTELRELRDRARPGDLTELQRAKERHASLLRSRIGLWSALGTVSDWNSPSIDHAVTSNAGRETGLVSAFVDDYKRDRHALAATYERRWLARYVDAPAQCGLRALATSCGMSAFVTIAHLLRLETNVDGPLLIGTGTYHECRDLLRGGISGRPIVEVDEADADEVVAAVLRHSPSAVYLDSMGNNSQMTCADLEALLDRLGTIMDGGTIVIDNTGRSVTFQPWHVVPRLRVILFESVTKYAQLGLDRTPAGMIVCSSADGELLDGIREHLGTNITDAAAGQLPVPDRDLLERRLARIDRNASVLAAALWIHVQKNALPVEVRHPSLLDHPASPSARDLRFRGGSLALGLAPSIDSHGARARLVEVILETARERNVPLVHGTSFGFDVTRVYLTAAHAEGGAPFVRISAGTEASLQMVAVGLVLRTALSRLCAEVDVSQTPGSCSIRSASHREPAIARPR